MAIISEVDQYIVVLMITLLFTVLALGFREEKPLSLLAGLCWLISAVVHFMVGDITSPLTYTIPLLYFVFGFGFILVTAIDTIKMLEERRHPNFFKRED